MLVVEFNQSVGIAGCEKMGAIQIALGEAAHQVSHAQIAIAQQGFHPHQPIALQDILLTQHLLVGGAQDGVRVGGRVSLALLGGSSRRKSLNPQGWSVKKGHENGRMEGRKRALSG
jgi:hypothetical protein